MDGSNVNLKFYEDVVTERNKNEQHRLINIGSCGLNTIHDAFNTGFEKSTWKIKNIKGAYCFSRLPSKERRLHHKNWIYSISTVFLWY